MKKIILYKAPLLPFLLKHLNIYARKNFLIKSFKNFTELGEDEFTAKDYRECDHLAAGNVEKIKSLIVNKYPTFLVKFGGKKYAEFFIEKEIENELRKIYASFIYAKKIYDGHNMKGNIYLWPDNFSIRIYKSIYSLNLLPEYIKIYPLAKAYLLAYSILKYVYLLSTFLFYPEIIYFLKKKKNHFKNKNFLNCVHLDRLLPDIEDTNIVKEDKIFKLFNKEETLFIKSSEKDRINYLSLKNYSFKIIELREILFWFNKIKYLKKYYLIDSIFRFRLILLSLKYPFLINECSKSMANRIKWQAFYQLFIINNNIKIMTPEDLTANIIHRNNNVRNIYTYFSTTESVVKDKIFENKGTYFENSHLICDYVISSKLSIKLIKSLKNDVGNYSEMGPLLSDLKVNVQKNNIYEILKIQKSKKVISFFDHTFGHIGVVTTDAYFLFLKTMINLSQKYKNVNFVFKSKKTIEQLKLKDRKVASLIYDMQAQSNLTYANESNLFPHEVYAISNLVIALPVSSVFYESLSSQTKSIVFDPKKQYKDFHLLHNKFPNLVAYDEIELEALIEYWLNEINDESFMQFLTKNISQYIDVDLNQSLFKKYNELLKSKFL